MLFFNFCNPPKKSFCKPPLPTRTKTWIWPCLSIKEPGSMNDICFFLSFTYTHSAEAENWNDKNRLEMLVSILIYCFKTSSADSSYTWMLFLPSIFSNFKKLCLKSILWTKNNNFYTWKPNIEQMGKSRTGSSTDLVVVRNLILSTSVNIIWSKSGTYAGIVFGG